MKKIVLFSFAVVLTLGFFGCASEPTKSTTGEQKVSSEEPVAATPVSLGVGDSATIDDITYTLNSVALTDERNQFDESNPAVVVAINYTVQNGSSDSYAYGADTAVYGPDGKKCDSYPLGTDFGAVSAGRAVDCTVYYGMNSVGEFEIEFQPLISFSDPAIFVAAV